MLTMNYLDKSILKNPLTEYVRWLVAKIFYQVKNWGRHLRIDYKAKISNSFFGRYNYIGQNTIITNSTIGDYTYVTEGANISNAVIGKFCSIGPRVIIAPGKHPSSVFVSTHPSIYSDPRNLIHNFVKRQVFEYEKNVKIGNDVWIGCNAVIIDGVSICDGAIIAANSVVVKNVEPYAIVGGNPAKLIKKRFEDDEIMFLLDFKWWDKPDAFIKTNITSWWSIKDFMAKYKTQ